MAQKSTVIKEFSIGKNTYKVGEVKSFSDEIIAKNADCLKKVKAIKERKPNISE